MKKLLTIVILPLCIIALAYLIITSINKPVKFNKEMELRKQEGIEILKDIRTLQVTYKSAYNHYAPCMDSLIDFYNNGHIIILTQFGSEDDSLAVAHTEAVKRNYRNLKGNQLNEKLYELYQAGDKNLIVRLPVPTAVRDTLFNGRVPAFDPEKLRYIPYSEPDTVIMRTTIKMVSGVEVPLFEAQIPFGFRPAPGEPFRGLLSGMDEQLIINLNAEREDTGRYPGLMVGSIENANNNAGNWE